MCCFLVAFFYLLQFHSHLKLLQTLLDLTCTINVNEFNLTIAVLEYLKKLISSKRSGLLRITKLLNVSDSCCHLKAIPLQLRNGFFRTDF